MGVYKFSVIDWINTRSGNNADICEEYNKGIVRAVEPFIRNNIPLTDADVRNYLHRKDCLDGMSVNEFKRIITIINEHFQDVKGGSDSLMRELMPITNRVLTKAMGMHMINEQCKEITFDNYELLKSLKIMNPDIQLPKAVEKNLEVYQELVKMREYKEKYISGINRIRAARAAIEYRTSMRAPINLKDGIKDDVDLYTKRMSYYKVLEKIKVSGRLPFQIDNRLTADIIKEVFEKGDDIGYDKMDEYTKFRTRIQLKKGEIDLNDDTFFFLAHEELGNRKLSPFLKSTMSLTGYLMRERAEVMQARDVAQEDFTNLCMLGNEFKVPIRAKIFSSPAETRKAAKTYVESVRNTIIGAGTANEKKYIKQVNQHILYNGLGDVHDFHILDFPKLPPDWSEWGLVRPCYEAVKTDNDRVIAVKAAMREMPKRQKEAKKMAEFAKFEKEVEDLFGWGTEINKRENKSKNSKDGR